MLDRYVVPVMYVLHTIGMSVGFIERLHKVNRDLCHKSDATSLEVIFAKSRCRVSSNFFRQCEEIAKDIARTRPQLEDMQGVGTEFGIDIAD